MVSKSIEACFLAELATAWKSGRRLVQSTNRVLTGRDSREWNNPAARIAILNHKTGWEVPYKGSSQFPSEDSKSAVVETPRTDKYKRHLPASHDARDAI